MIVTIDGPAGAGKSTVARALARRLGFRFLDTGAMYRTVALASIRAHIEPRSGALDVLVGQLKVQWDNERILLDGEDVSDAIRSWEVTKVVSDVADNPDVRAKLVEWQRAAAAGWSTVTEGRDQGTVVFPDAERKFFLTASPQVRAQRRWLDLHTAGQDRSLDEVLAQQELRDEQDRNRPLGALLPAPDAIHIDTDGLDLQRVVDILEAWVRTGRGLPGNSQDEPS